MKKIGIGILCAYGLVVAFLLGWFVDFSKHYNEAEPLVEIVWPMADDVEAFVEETGRRPVSLAEVERQSGTDLEELKKYKHRFFSEGPWIFHLTVNKKYGFGIDEAFRPQWTGADSDAKPADGQTNERVAGSAKS